MTMGSSWAGSIAVKSLSVNVIGGMCGRRSVSSLPNWSILQSETACYIVNFLWRYDEQHWSDNRVDNFTKFLLGSASTFRTFTSRSCSSDRTFASFSPICATVVVVVSVISSSRAFPLPGIINVALGRPRCRHGCLNTLANMTGLNKLFYFILQCLTTLSRMTVIAVILATLNCIGIGRCLCLFLCGD